jgi:hypothetical protein
MTHPTHPEGGHDMTDDLTSIETRLAERYVSVLDFVSRCALAVDEGNWHYLWDKADQLTDAAGRLRAVAEENWQQVAAGGTRPRTAAVTAAVAYWGRHYRAGRLLHPEAGP